MRARRTDEEQAARMDALKRIPMAEFHPSNWPPGVRGIGVEELNGLGVDANGRLYWDGKPVEIVGVRLSKWQRIGAFIVGSFVVIAALAEVAQAIAAYR